MMRGAGCRCAGRRRAKEPEDEIDVMAGLGEEGTVAVLRGAAPVPAHVGVGEMPPADGLAVLDGDNVSDDVVGQQKFAEEDVVRAVAQDVADGEDLGWFFSSLWWGESPVDR